MTDGRKMLLGDAVVSSLPYRDGDGYSFGGEIVLTIGGRSILLSPRDDILANEIARRWNAVREHEL